MTDKLFVTCGQGLEPLLQKELAELGYEETTRGFRGVYVPFNSLEPIYHINYCSRLATRVLLPLVKFRIRDARELYENAGQIRWTKYLPKGKTFAIDANVAHPKLRNSLYAAQVVKDAICDQLRAETGQRPSIDTKAPDVQINLFIHDFAGIISIDTSGTPLHKRGYRIEGGMAPLHETLAAAILRLAEYRGDEIVYDPCCGSGTFLIEAAMVAAKIPPGFLRKSWGFTQLPDYDLNAWLKVKNAADDQKIPLKKGMIFGTDINRDAVRITKTNLRAAGFTGLIEAIGSDFSDFTPPTLPNFVITNPPHGLRIGEEETLYSTYERLGDWMKERTQKPAQGAVFTSNPNLGKVIGLAAKQRIPLESGGTDSRLLLFDLYE